MEKKKFNWGMFISSLLFSAVGWAAAEFLLLSGVLPTEKMPLPLKAGLYVALIALCAVTGIVLAEIKGRHYTSLWAKGVFRRCVILAYLCGVLGSLAAGGIAQYLYQMDLRFVREKPDDLIFLTDVSGSMDGILEQGKEASIKIVQKLDSAVEASLITFWLEADERLPFTKMDEEGKKKLGEALESMGALGGTDYVQALDGVKAAIGEKKTSILMLTDGKALIPEPEVYVQEFQKTGTRLHVVGFRVNSEENPALKEIADKTGGSYTTVDEADELTAVFGEIYGEIYNNQGFILERTEGESPRQTGVRVGFFLLLGILWGLAYAFIPNNLHVTFYNGMTGLLAGILMAVGMRYIQPGAGQVLLRLAAMLLVGCALCSYRVKTVATAGQSTGSSGDVFL